MKSFLSFRKPRWGLAIGLGLLIDFGVILILFSILLMPIGGPFGYWDAKRDIAQGHYVLKGAGILHTGTLYRSRMKEQYGIEVTGIGGCLSTEYENSYRRTYNAQQAAAFKKRTGMDLFEVSSDCLKQAREEERKAFAEKRKNP